MSPHGPAPQGAVVAVLAKRGRLLVAEPLFAPPTAIEGDVASRRPERLVVDARLPRGKGRASAGQLVLVAFGKAVGSGRSRGRGPARIKRVLGRPDVARDVIEGLMLDRGLRRAFDPAVEHDAREARERVAEAVSGAEAFVRRDLRELATFTIDPASARDFDDAISAQDLGDGLVRVWVHIADVCAFVAPGSPLDREAQRRATSVYVPGAVEPMLPSALSDDACSLAPGRERPAVTVELDLQGADVKRASFYRSLIRSDERLDYERVDRIFAGADRAHEPWAAPLAAARAAADALQLARERRGALVLDSPEPEFVLNKQGHITDVRGRVATESHRLIEHLMIAANEAVARLLHQRDVPCLYRVHERPAPERVRRLIEQLASIDVATPPLPELLSPSQAAALVGEASQLVADHVRRTGRGRLALPSLVLRALTRAHYSPTNIGHAGLSSPFYCHFTSPIRRYPDLVCHRALLAALGAGEQAPSAGPMSELGVWTSERERGAMTIERDADDIARCFALEALLYEAGPKTRMVGEVTGVIGGGAFVGFGTGEDADTPPPFAGMLSVRRLRGHVARAATGGRGRATSLDSSRARPDRGWWEVNEEGTILSGGGEGDAVRLGDPIEVRVLRVETARGRVELEPAG